jgi:hypothetical protein
MPRAAKEEEKEIEHRKARKDRKESKIPVRVTDEQKDKITAAAERAGLDPSTMLRLLGLREYEAPTLVQQAPPSKSKK